MDLNTVSLFNSSVNYQPKFQNNNTPKIENGNERQEDYKKAQPELLQVYFGAKRVSPAKKELQAILKQKIKENGKITPDMIDQNMSKLLFQVSTDMYKNAYAPYSGFRVGAAIITEKGNIFEGVNIENVTYNSNLHGETTAISNMIIHEGPEAKIAAIATCSEKVNPATSCGSCRQNVAEFSRTWDTKQITANSLTPSNEDIIVDRLGDMLPNGFSPSILRSDNIT